MTRYADQQRRVLAVRCPAWQPPGQQPSRHPSGPPSSGQTSPGQETGPEARAFEQVVSVVQEFCPRIEVVRPGICAFGARGPARYFGGESELGRKITEAVSRLGIDCAVGIADGLFAALLASRDALIELSPAEILPPPASTPGSPASTPGSPASTPGSPASTPGSPASTSRRSAGNGPAAPPVRVVPPGGTPVFLAPRAVTVLGEPDLADLLVRLGIRTLGEFAAVPASEAGNRFGAQGLIAHRLARGLDPRPLVAGPPPEDLSVQVEFDPPVEQSERVVFAAKSLAGQMHAQLAESGLACVRVQVQVVCDDGQEITRLWRHDGLLSELAVAERVRWQLDGWRAGSTPGTPAAAGTPTAAPGTPAAPGTSATAGTPTAAPRTVPGIPDEPNDGIYHGGISLLRLIPDQLVRDQGRQLGLWGDAVVSDRVARAAVRVQAMLGHDAVRQPVLTGGRGPSDQAVLVPFGDTQASSRPVDRPVDRPWPGRIPPPAPATVYPVPRPAQVTDGLGTLVTVTGRGQVSADPARLSMSGGPPLAITAWTGPWPVTERWWDPEHACRKARFQLVTVDGAAWLAIVQNGRWLIEASYD